MTVATKHRISWSKFCYGMISFQPTFPFICKGLHGGGTLQNLDQWFPNEAPAHFSSFSERNSEFYPFYTVGYQIKFHSLKRCFFCLNFFFIHWPMISERKDMQDVEKSLSSDFNCSTYCVTSYLIYIWVSISSSTKWGIYVNVFSTLEFTFHFLFFKNRWKVGFPVAQ